MDINEFYFLAKLATQICDSKISLITIVEGKDQKPIAEYGIAPDQIPSLVSFVTQIIGPSKEIVQIENYNHTQNSKQTANFLKEFPTQFLIGIPLVSEDGSILGAISVLDDNPKTLTANQLELLREITTRVKHLIQQKPNNTETNELILQSSSSDGKSLSLFGTKEAIAEIRKLEKDLRASETAFRGNFDNAAVGMALIDENGKWLKVNKRVCEIVGYTESELMQLTFQDITHPDDLNADLSYLEELVADKRRFYQMEKRYFHKNGNIVYIILAVSMVKNEEGKVHYFVSQIIDITEWKLVEQKLKLALAKNQAILDASTLVAIISTDTEGIITEFNNGAERMLGYNSDELIGKYSPKIFHIESEIENRAKLLMSEYNQTIEGFDVLVYNAKIGKPNTLEWTYKRKDGSTFPVLLSITALKQNEKISGFLGVAVDISELKKQKRKLSPYSISRMNRTIG